MGGGGRNPPSLSQCREFKLGHEFKPWNGSKLSPIDDDLARQDVVEAALALVEKGPKQDGEEDHQGKPEQERVEGRDQRCDLAAKPHGHGEPHHTLANRCRLRAADGERVVAEADRRKDQAVEQPGEAQREDAEDRDRDHGNGPEQRNDDRVDEKGDAAFADDGLEQLRLRHRIEGMRLVAKIGARIGGRRILLGHGFSESGAKRAYRTWGTTRAQTTVPPLMRAKRWRNARARLPSSSGRFKDCLLYTSPSPRDGLLSRMPSSA